MNPWQVAWATRHQHFAPQIGFARPHRTLAVSLTGGECALNCAHCAGHYLRQMVHIRNADATGMTSCLISGGCDSLGKVPAVQHLATIAKLRAGRTLNWHVGMIDQEELGLLAPSIDIISFDFVGDNDTIREVYGLDYTVDDYARTYAMLREHATVVPHLTLGLRGGQFSGETHALHLLQALGLDALVLLVLIPTRGTRYSLCEPPSLESVSSFLLMTRCALPDTPIYLGCMRPGGQYRRRLDALAVRAGVNKIVNPAPSAVQLAEERGLGIHWEDECCIIRRP